MTLQKVNITDSIHLSCIQTDKFKTGLLTFTLLLPTTCQNIICNAVLPGVLRRGTERYPDMASLNCRLDDLYASCVEIRSTQIGKNLALIFSAEMLDDAYTAQDISVIDGVIEVISEMLLHPKLSEGEFLSSSVKQEINFELDSLRASVNNTRSYALLRLTEMMFQEDHCFPTLEERITGLENLTAKHVTDHYRRIQTISRIEVFYAGSLAAEKLVPKLRRAFSEWSPQSTPELRFPAPAPNSRYRTATETMPVSQGKLAMGFRTGAVANGTDNLYATALLFNELFGGAPSSKLFMNVREKMNLCYYCSSSYSQYTGIMTVSSGIRSQNRAIVEQAILAQLEEIRKGNITQAEWHAARASLENACRQMYDNPFDLQSFYGNRSLFGITEDIEECRQKILQVTTDDVIRLAAQTACDTVFFVEGIGTTEQEEADDDE